MRRHYDIVVIGAGPAGMAACINASNHGASVILLDEKSAAGGQIYRGVAQQRLADKSILGAEYYHGLDLVEKLDACNADHITGATVWQISTEREIGVSINGTSHLITADQIIIATGATERPFPVPGWTLPGVMGAGAAQVALKSGGVLMPDAVFIGTGPLLYLVAHQYLRAGVPIKAILDTTPRGNWLRALPFLPSALPQYGALTKGQRWIKELRAAGIPFIRGVDDVKCIGTNAVEAVKYKKGKHWAQIETDYVLLHQGIVPNANLAISAGCKHIWSAAQLCWHVEVDHWYESDIAGIAVAGDNAAINGAIAAQHSGEI
ncbi:MAG: FAD-dependent oxidoreductase, partial [Proteobacteria bacterium]|nr:FAD-dependent oxidoreductase [Pseudomonadota bacterium]